MLFKDEGTERELKNIIIILELDEEKELMTSLENLIRNPEGNHSRLFNEFSIVRCSRFLETL